MSPYPAIKVLEKDLARDEVVTKQLSCYPYGILICETACEIYRLFKIS